MNPYVRDIAVIKNPLGNDGYRGMSGYDQTCQTLPEFIDMVQ
jgi:hypothetical protein